mmetsp:Transcript_62010/g.166405  ORF Transcript_62010/g.166405 Transcript_62010/m.166405 type:complete len:84 (-) Transcript_62010:2-253(-)
MYIYGANSDVSRLRARSGVKRPVAKNTRPGDGLSEKPTWWILRARAKLRGDAAPIRLGDELEREVVTYIFGVFRKYMDVCVGV